MIWKSRPPNAPAAGRHVVLHNQGMVGAAAVVPVCRLLKRTRNACFHPRAETFIAPLPGRAAAWNLPSATGPADASSLVADLAVNPIALA